MSDELDLSLDAEEANLLGFWGRRGCGKSRAARYFFDSYPFDRIVIDPNGDMEVPGAIELVPPIPKIPTLENGRYQPAPAPWPWDELGRVTLHYVPDLSDEDERANTDDVVRLAFARGRCFLLVDEAMRVAQANRVLPAMDLTLQQFRHRDETIALCGPRPVGIEPLCITQADLTFLYRMRGIQDRKRIAEVTGLDLDLVSGLLMNLPRFESVVLDDRDGGDEEGETAIIQLPPLPAPEAPRVPEVA
jgi:hypothetical protein